MIQYDDNENGLIDSTIKFLANGTREHYFDIDEDGVDNYLFIDLNNDSISFSFCGLSPEELTTRYLYWVVGILIIGLYLPRNIIHSVQYLINIIKIRTH